ncbi:ubiquinone biosynthesis accessory factor UbiJ [Massilia pseudoviolaceinigra]|uniref:ubiquinone biosynthesis accessory factor UbiJ n=1 Tax=Massilia pseudoviolaceinigra TaxID=3057165 RepID=UPI0027969375|nr:SCP2 sterol-binding domain-containing protein [Massilia sp. CCM 9206]MDQ1920007.1 SCP2 sterol-binding domain-containing protein [Massilia sp. CCM 9206]
MSPPNSFTPQSALMAPAIAAINHLLAQEAWARDALAPHSGKVACIDASGIALRLLVTRDGMVEASPAGTPEEGASVTIRVKLADLPLIAQNRERAFSYVKIEGDAEFANTISQLSKGLRWEAEHDLERLIGPIAATRLVGGARSVFDGVRAAHGKVAENLAEFFLEEQPLLVRPATVDDFGAEVSRLRDDVERTAKRLARLEQKLAPTGAAPDALNAAGQQKLDL